LMAAYCRINGVDVSVMSSGFVRGL